MRDYIIINRILRRIVYRCWEGIQAPIYDEGPLAKAIEDYLKRDLRDLEQSWPLDFDDGPLRALREHVDSGHLDNLVEEIVPNVEDAIDRYYGIQQQQDLSEAVFDLLHPIIVESSYRLFRQGHYRQAITDAIMAIFDMIRERTGIDADGARLVGQAFSLDAPMLVIADLKTESGRNEQKGFIQMLQGAYQGIRNPKSHSRQLNPGRVATAQNLVFSSLLARRVEEATMVRGKPDRTKSG